MMTGKNKRLIAGVAVIAGLMPLGQARAAYLIEYQNGEDIAFADWGTEAQKSGDGVTHDITTAPYPDDGVGGHTKALVADPNVGSPSTPLTDVHFTTAANLIGDLSAPEYRIQFDFYASSDGAGAGAPQGLGFYFQGNGDDVWYYSIDTSYISDGWNTYSVAFDWNESAYAGGWYGYTDNTLATPILLEATFDGAVADVSRLGFLLTYNDNNSTQEWGVDDFGLTVPEPETYLVLGMALLSVAIVFRKRISDSLAEARAMMHA